MRTPFQAALLITLLFKRSEKNRARISDTTVRKLAQRERLRSAFIDTLTDELDGLGIVLIELERGGFGLIHVSTLNGAPSITAKKYLKDDLKRIRRKESDFDDIMDEIGWYEDPGEDEDY